jgi:hypothetical protein
MRAMGNGASYFCLLLANFDGIASELLYKSFVYCRGYGVGEGVFFAVRDIFFCVEEVVRHGCVPPVFIILMAPNFGGG